MNQVYWSVLPERATMRQPFINFMRLAERAGTNGFQYVPIPQMRPDVARDYLCSEFKKLTQNPDDVLVQLDVDHNHPVDIIERLVANDKPICAAYAVKSDPGNPIPCMWTRDQNGILRIPRPVAKDLIQVAVTGSGAIAIKRSVFTALDEAGFDKGYWKYQYYPDGSSGSEDIFFSQICEEVGIPVFVDGRIVAPHWTEGELDDISYEEWCVDNPVVHREHKVSVIIPQRGRKEKAEKCLWSLYETAPNVEVIFISDDDEEYDWNLPPNFTEGNPLTRLGIRVHNPRDTAINKWNEGARLASGDVLMVAANDVEFGEGWLGHALDALDSVPDGNAMVAVNDTVTTIEVSSPHFLMSREYIVKYNGGVLMPPCYKKQFPDVENRLRAQSLGRYVCARAAKVVHFHPLTNTAPMDEIYKLGLDTFEEDRKLCEERQRSGFVIDWEPMLK